MKLVSQRKKERYDEIESIRTSRAHYYRRDEKLTPKDFHEMLTDTLQKMPPHIRAKFGKELKEFLDSLEQIQASTQVKLDLAYQLTQAQVNPRVIKELTA